MSNLAACKASRTKGEPARSSASQGWATITFPQRLQRCPVIAALCGSNFAVKGKQPALIRGPRRASNAGTIVLASNTLIPATTQPAIPMDRTSLIGTVSSARNPMATVDAGISSVRPA